MTAVDEVFISGRCRAGQHNRCRGLTPSRACSCACGHPAAVNVRAAGAVALQTDRALGDAAISPQEARLLLDMLGLADEFGAIAPDDRAHHYIEPIGKEPGSDGPPPPRRAMDEPPPANVTTPPGLRILAPSPPPPRRSRESTVPAKRRTPSAAPRKAASPKADAAPERATRAASPVVCGTVRGWRAHRNRKEQPCQPCRDAANEYQRQRYYARKGLPVPPAKQARQPAAKPAAAPTSPAKAPATEPGTDRRGGRPRPPCGTRNGYQAHGRRKETACAPCRAANAEAQRDHNRRAKPQKTLEQFVIELDVWFAVALASPHPAVRLAARRAAGYLSQLCVAMDDLARAERATTERSAAS